VSDQEPWEPPDRHDLKQVAQDLADEYGWSATDDRLRVSEWLANKGLLSPLDFPDEVTDSDSIDYVESHIRWLLS
jgi:hypothetical protein